MNKVNIVVTQSSLYMYSQNIIVSCYSLKLRGLFCGCVSVYIWMNSKLCFSLFSFF